MHPCPPRLAALPCTAASLPSPSLPPPTVPAFPPAPRSQTAVTLVGLALAPLYSWLFIFYLDLRLAGAAVAVDATQVGGRASHAQFEAHAVLADHRRHCWSWLVASPPGGGRRCHCGMRGTWQA